MQLQANIDEFLPLRDVVFNTLRKAILTGELQPGERLMEIHLANQLGVSRTPIREAIHKLALEGLVIMIPRRGAEVAQITEKSLKDVLEVRRALVSKPLYTIRHVLLGQKQCSVCPCMPLVPKGITLGSRISKHFFHEQI